MDFKMLTCSSKVPRELYPKAIDQWNWIEIIKNMELAGEFLKISTMLSSYNQKPNFYTH